MTRKAPYILDRIIHTEVRGGDKTFKGSFGCGVSVRTKDRELIPYKASPPACLYVGVGYSWVGERGSGVV